MRVSRHQPGPTWAHLPFAMLYAVSPLRTFRDAKDVHFGMALSATDIRNTDRRDRLLFLGAIAHALLTLLGAAVSAAVLIAR